MMTLTGKTGTSLQVVLALSRIAWDGPHEGAMEITGFQELRVQEYKACCPLLPRLELTVQLLPHPVGQNPSQNELRFQKLEKHTPFDNIAVLTPASSRS